VKVRFEELGLAQRAGGIESAMYGLVPALAEHGVEVSRSALEPEFPRGRLPDCVHFHGIWSPALVSRFRAWRKAGVPCLVSPHGMLEPWALAHKRWKKAVAWYLYQKRMLNQFQGLHGTSEREVAQFAKLGLQVRAEIIPWGVNMPEATSISRPPLGKLRAALFVGRIYPVKGLPLLVEAWSRVRPQGWKMLLMGPDEAGHRKEVEAAIAKHRLGDVVAFLGELKDEAKDEIYRQAQLFILPSYTENFGLVVTEALAHGLPVVTTQGTPWSGLTQKRCGWWVPTSVDGLTQGIQEACSLSPEDLNSMGQRGRVWMEREFSWNRVAVSMKMMYQNIVNL
jgi:glycosyltransferase involved in cell wall biosynthesis